MKSPERLKLPGLQHSFPVLRESRFSAAPLQRIKYQQAPKYPGRLEKGRNVDIFASVSFDFLRLPFCLVKPWFPCSSMVLDGARYCPILLDAPRC